MNIEEHKSEDRTERPDSYLTRRDLFRVCGRHGALLCLLPMLAEGAEAQSVPPPGWVSVGMANQFLEAQPRKIAAAGNLFFVTRVDDARLIAVSAICTHQRCELVWQKGENQYRCPCHGATFTPTGKNLRGPAIRPLTRFLVKQKNGEVLVRIANKGVGPVINRSDKDAPPEKSNPGRKNGRDDRNRRDPNAG